MQIKGKVHCLFEQSGTFKNEFKKLGIDAYDYDIQNNFGETDYQIDLFEEIEKAYSDEYSIFDKMYKDDLIMSFFPCIYFESMQHTYYNFKSNNLRGKGIKGKYDVVIDRIKKREEYYILLYKMFAVCEINGLRMIFENPATKPHYLLHTQNFIPYTFIDKNRRLRGDYFIKPTAYWFLNCEPTTGYSYQKPKEIKTIKNSEGGKGLFCSEERSLISPDYARNFICDFILGEKQKYSMQDIFKDQF